MESDYAQGRCGTGPVVEKASLWDFCYYYCVSLRAVEFKPIDDDLSLVKNCPARNKKKKNANGGLITTVRSDEIVDARGKKKQ